jgi:dephospho-CoA kinase
MSLLVGLSGGIATGKSTVAKLLTQLGATVIDADAIVHEQQAPGQPLLQELAKAFGAEILRADGSLDRARLGELVFKDPDARALLGKLTHPRVIAEMKRRAELARAQRGAVVILDIPLLFEGVKTGSGAAVAFDYDLKVLVYASPDQQVERQISRNGYGRDEAERRIAAQMPIDEKKALADRLIDNRGSPEETERQVRALFAELSERAAAAAS